MTILAFLTNRIEKIKAVDCNIFSMGREGWRNYKYKEKNQYSILIRGEENRVFNIFTFLPFVA